MYKCRWLITPINLRDAMRGKSRTQRKIGNTGLTYEQIKKQWKTEAVEIASSCKNKKDELVDLYLAYEDQMDFILKD